MYLYITVYCNKNACSSSEIAFFRGAKKAPQKKAICPLKSFTTATKRLTALFSVVKLALSHNLKTLNGKINYKIVLEKKNVITSSKLK